MTTSVSSITSPEPVLELFGDAHVSLAVNREHHRLHSADMLALVDAEVLDSAQRELHRPRSCSGVTPALARANADWSTT